MSPPERRPPRAGSSPTASEDFEDTTGQHVRMLGEQMESLTENFTSLDTKVNDGLAAAKEDNRRLYSEVSGQRAEMRTMNSHISDLRVGQTKVESAITQTGASLRGVLAQMKRDAEERARSESLAAQQAAELELARQRQAAELELAKKKSEIELGAAERRAEIDDRADKKKSRRRIIVAILETTLGKIAAGVAVAFGGWALGKFLEFLVKG